MLSVDIGHPAGGHRSRVCLWALSSADAAPTLLVKVKSPHNYPLRSFVVIPERKKLQRAQSARRRSTTARRGTTTAADSLRPTEHPDWIHYVAFSLDAMGYLKVWRITPGMPSLQCLELTHCFPTTAWIGSSPHLETPRSDSPFNLWLMAGQQLRCYSIRQLTSQEIVETSSSGALELPSRLFTPLDLVLFDVGRASAVGLVVETTPRTVWTALGETLSVWDANSLNLRRTLVQHNSPITSLTHNINRQPSSPLLVVSGDMSGVIHVWDTAQFTSTVRLISPFGFPTFYAFMPSSEELWASFQAGRISVWKSASRRVLPS